MRILRIFADAQSEFSQSLLLLVERLVLHRLTTAKKQSQELATLVRSIKEIAAASRGPANLPPQVSRLNAVDGDGEEAGQSRAPLVNSFRDVVDAIETMDTSELYELVSRLRNEPLKRKVNRTLFADV
jgi:hypothetical protein